MTLTLSTRNFILGKNRFIPAHTQFKRVLLTGQLCLVAMAICLIYMVLGVTMNLVTTWPLLVGGFVFSLAGFILNRNGNYTAAKMIFALSVNAIVFLLCLVEPFEAGLYTFFIICGLGAMTIFGYEERGKATFFVCLSAALFFISMVAAFNFKPNPVYTQDYVRINILINFTGSLIATILIVYFLVSVNHHSESVLRNNEQQIKKKNLELVKLNTELDRFVYSTSHDLRAPISSIQGLIQLTRMTNEPSEVRQYIDIMQGRLGNLTKFIGDISDYARNARVELSIKLVGVNEMVDEILEGLQFYPVGIPVKIKKNIPEGFRIVTDPIRLHVILSNLITNAFKYADQRKELSEITIAASLDEGTVSFMIRDNGIGIREEYQPRIFEMFFQGTDKAEGSGLGLFIVKESVDKLGGTIAVESALGAGAAFSVTLPALTSPTYAGSR